MTQSMKTISILLAIAASALLPAFSLAQSLGPPGDAENGPVPIALIPGYVYVNTKTNIQYTANEATQLVPGTYAEQNNGKATGRIIVIRRSYGALTLYPIAAFSQAGQLFNSSTGSVNGGTRTIDGPLLVGVFGVPLKKKGQTFEIGGFYFKPRNGANAGDILQLNGTVFVSPTVGFQVSSFASQDHPTRVWGTHVILRMSHASLNSPAHPFDISASVGVLFNSEKLIGNFGNGTTKDASSANLSLALSGSYAIGKQTSLSGTYWHVRDRNVESTRFGVGLSIKF